MMVFLWERGQASPKSASVRTLFTGTFLNPASVFMYIAIKNFSVVFNDYLAGMGKQVS